MEFCIIFRGKIKTFDKLIKAELHTLRHYTHAHTYSSRTCSVNFQNVITILFRECSHGLEFEKGSSAYEPRQIFARPFIWKRIVRTRAPWYFVTKFRECMPSKGADFQKFERI